MSTINYLTVRNTVLPVVNATTLTVSSVNFRSTMISLGQSTNQSYTNFSNGSFTTGWASTLTGATSIKKVVLSPNGSIQTILQNSGSTMSTVITSLNSGSTWAGSTMRGLPTSGALPYQTYGSTINAMTVPSITAITAAPSGTNQLAIASNELVYASANSGATFAATGLGQNNSPFIYLPFDGSVADVMGNSAVTATATSGSISYVPGKVGTNAVNLVNTAGGTATQYVRGTWTGSNSFTVSFWFNAQTLSGYANLFMTFNGAVSVYLNIGNNTISLYVGGTSINGPVVSTNTWYNITIVYQNGGTSSLYVNNAFSASGTGSWNAANITGYGIGAADVGTPTNAFNGYICDFRIYNYAVTNPSGAALINPLVGPIMPFVYLTFDGSTTTDVMGNSTVTATGSPGFVVGQVGSNALSLASNAGTGGNPTQYVTGTISGLGNAITFSVWFQALILPTSNQACIWSMNAVTSGGAIVQLRILTTGILSFQYYNGSAWQIVDSTSAISLNTWYNAICIYQAGSTCSLYLNGALTTMTGSGSITPAIASYTLGGGQGTPATPFQGFKGYIDDFRVYTGAFTPSQLSPVLYSPSHAIGSPNIYLPFENGSVLDTMGYSAISARGMMNFVPGVVGTAALNLVNPAGGTAVNYLRGSWAGSPNFTVSFWFNVQAFGGTQHALFVAYAGNYVIALNASNQITWYIPSGGSGLIAVTGPVVSINTWYYVSAIFQTNGTCSLYVNNSLAGTYTNSGGVGSYTTTAFAIGTYDTSTPSAFNGYIDDFKLYNCAVPFSALGPMNYTQAALSNSGAYQVVAAANGGVYTSANSGSTWSQATTSPQVASAVNTVGGQLITPQLTSLAAATWTQNGVSWVASASSIYTTNYAYYAFNNISTGTAFASSTTYTAGGVTQGGSPSTSVSGLSAQLGEWLQLQSSVPLVMSSYLLSCGGTPGYQPKTYIIVGSNDGTTWYPIQSATFSGNAYTTAFTSWQQSITVNLSGSQTITAQNTVTATTVTYGSTTTSAYTYFRLIGTATYGTLLEIGEWYINFTTPPTPLYVAPSTALIANQSLNAITVMPQQTGLSSNTWTTNGVSWVASASATFNGSTLAYSAFNNSLTSVSWAGAANAYSSSSPYAYTANTYSTSILGGVGTIAGDWLQLQTSAPVVMSSYTWQSSGIAQQPKNYYIIGSNDGTNWYPIQYASGNTTPFTAFNQLCTSYLLVTTTTITQTIQGGQAGSFTTIGYPTSTNSYTYFRLVVTANWGYLNGNTNVGQWYINFTAYTPALLQSLSMSPTGQYMALTGAGAVAPQLTGLAASTWTANGVSWTASASSSLLSFPLYPYFVFNNNYTGGNSWANSTTNYAITTGSYSGSASTTIIGVNGGNPVLGEWVQIQSSTPLVMSSYTFAVGGTITNQPKVYYIVGSTDNINWYPIQFASMTTNPFTAIYTICSTYITVNQSGIQTIQGGQTGSGTFVTYPTTTNAYTYFRLLTTTVFGSGSLSYCEIGEWYINFQSGPTFYSTDYGSSWTRSLSAATIPNANVLATSGNGQYTLQASGQTVFIAINTSVGNPTGTYTTPTFSPALSNAVSNAAISATGQYMVVLIQSTTNNVYYSSNYGVSFTGITLGSTAMVSCAVSADGSYITVASATQVFTLNSNTQGLSITVGNQSGLINQGQNAVAIGNQAGLVNQSANSIILNSSGTAVNAYAPGFFVAPVALAGSSVSSSFAVLGYGTDSQVVQTGVNIRADGVFTGTASFAGNVGIGTTNPSSKLHIVGDLNASAFTINNSETGWGYNFSMVLRNNQPNPSVFHFLQKAGGNGAYHTLTQGGDHIFLSMDQRSGVAGGNGIVICGWDQVAGLRIGPSSSNFSGNVGIGTPTPAASLDVNGSIISRAQSPSIAFLGDIDGAKWTQKLGGYNLSFGSDSGLFTGFENSISYGRTFQYGVQMTSNGGMNIKGNVGIGTQTPAASLDVNGTSKLGGIGTAFKSVVAFIATLGSGGAGVVQFTITFPSAYTNTTKLIINVTMLSDFSASYGDTFSCTIRSIATTSFVLNVVRTDAASGWGLSLRANVVVYELP